jgi:hypothetical protein
MHAQSSYPLSCHMLWCNTILPSDKQPTLATRLMKGLGATIGVLYLGYRGPPVAAQHPGHNLLDQQPNDWSRAPNARHDPTTPDQGRQGPPIPGGSLGGTNHALRDPGTSREPNNRPGRSVTSYETHLTGHDDKPHVLPPEGFRSPDSKAFHVRVEGPFPFPTREQYMALGDSNFLHQRGPHRLRN